MKMTMYLIQSELKAPKGQFNSFGKYNYRSCEDIVEAVKPILAKYQYHLIMSDEVVGVGNRVYIKATCKVLEADKVIAESTALAREAEVKKGMDDSQITGTASSYARKYALNGLFAIDDTKDADTDAHRHQQGAVQPPNESAKSIAKSVWDEMSEEEQIFLNDIGMEMVVAIDDNNMVEACRLFYEQKLTQEEQTALWSRLDSKQRSAIKKYRDTLKEK
jgi:hypothetical protein